MQVLWSFNVLVVAGSLVAGSALAQEEGGPSGPRHEGFMFRLAPGFGGAITENELAPSIELSGSAGFFSLDLGGTVAKRLALHARLSAHAMVEPTATVDGQELGELRDASLSIGMLGLGLTYYFESNLYLTGVVGISTATLEIGGEEAESDAGLGLVADLGYEWPVGGDWGLGIAARLESHRVPDDPDTIVATALGILFSATYH